jgi:predicted glycosyltransferase
MKAWIDIDNPPQARYLLPIARGLEDRGWDVLITARAYGDTFAILQSEGVAFEAVGLSFGKGIVRKLRGLRQRTKLLVDYVGRQSPSVEFVVTGSRAATLAARSLRVPSFVIVDYEYVDMLVYALSNAYILHPDVISPRAFRRKGIRSARLIPFDGLKEALTFSGLDVAAIPPYEFASLDASDPRVLFRPPAEDSHYFSSASRTLALDLLRHLAERDAQVIFAPRTREQAAYLDVPRQWRKKPYVLEPAVPFVPLLKSVDAVVSAGGTMLREAAYLGMPAYSIFKGRTGAVDRHLASLGRLSLISSGADFERLKLVRSGPISPIPSQSDTVEFVISSVLERVQQESHLPQTPRRRSSRASS